MQTDFSQLKHTHLACFQRHDEPCRMVLRHYSLSRWIPVGSGPNAPAAGYYMLGLFSLFQSSVSSKWSCLSVLPHSLSLWLSLSLSLSDSLSLWLSLSLSLWFSAWHVLYRMCFSNNISNSNMWAVIQAVRKYHTQTFQTSISSTVE